MICASVYGRTNSSILLLFRSVSFRLCCVSSRTPCGDFSSFPFYSYFLRCLCCCCRRRRRRRHSENSYLEPSATSSAANLARPNIHEAKRLAAHTDAHERRLSIVVCDTGEAVVSRRCLGHQMPADTGAGLAGRGGRCAHAADGPVRPAYQETLVDVD